MAKLILLGACLFLFLTPAAEACSCGVIRLSGPCMGLGNEGHLFVGTVVESAPAEPDEVGENGEVVAYLGSRQVTFSVEEEFTGSLGGHATIFTGSGAGDCGYVFESGRRYLVSAHEYEGQLSTSICTITAPLEHALHMVNQFRRMKKGERPASVYGIIAEHVYDPFTYEVLGNKVLGEIPISLRSEAGVFSTRTDVHGTYAFYDLPAGRYITSAELPSGYQLRTTHDRAGLQLSAMACTLHELAAIPTGRIQGMVVSETGAPLEGIQVILKRPDAPKESPHETHRWLGDPTSLTDAEGRFVFDELPDGDYVVGYETANRKFRTAFHTTNELNEPPVIRIAKGNTTDLGTTTLTAWHDQYSANFVVLWSDGSLAKDAGIYSVTLPDGRESARQTASTDVHGRAELHLLSEYTYRVTAEVECRGGTSRNAKPVTVEKAGEYMLILSGDRCEPEPK